MCVLVLSVASVMACDDDSTHPMIAVVDGGQMSPRVGLRRPDMMATSPNQPTLIQSDTSASLPDMGKEDGSTFLNDAIVDADSSTQILGPRVTIRGRVWAPGNGPSSARAGEAIPIAGALITLTQNKPPAIPDRIYCEPCAQLRERAKISDAQGRFQFDWTDQGRFYLTVQKGQFRRTRVLEVNGPNDIDLSEELTTLPSQHNPDLGDFLPRIAVLLGNSDAIEDVLAKMGLGSLDEDSLFIPASAESRLELWDNGGIDAGQANQGTLPDLLRNFDRLATYHIVFIPCSGIFDYSRAIREPEVLTNLRRYVALGGKLYVTDWSGEFADAVFPAQMQLTPGQDTPPEAYDAMNNTWNPDLFGDANGQHYDSHNSEVTDAIMAEWLGAQSGPLVDGGTGPYDPSRFSIQGAWNTILAVHSVPLGRNSDGEDVIDEPKVWVTGGRGYQPRPKLPLTVSFEPVGCGRVLYSVYHTADEAHEGMYPQERILLYLIMEIGICRDPKTTYQP